jgi:hypothetical protein
MASTSNRMSGSTTVWDVGVMCASWTANPDRSCQARLRLRFERSDRGAAGQLLRLGAGIEVLDPPELRPHMADAALRLAAL